MFVAVGNVAADSAAAVAYRSFPAMRVTDALATEPAAFATASVTDAVPPTTTTRPGCKRVSSLPTKAGRADGVVSSTGP